MKRYFEYKDDKSSKFWEIQLKDKNISTRYGKIGTDGQTSKKSFATIDLAKKEYEKLIKEKIKKGYKEENNISQIKITAENIVPKPSEDVYDNFFLIFYNSNKDKKWIIKLWSNQLEFGSMNKNGEWKLEKKNFYNANQTHQEQRKKAEEEYTKQIEEKLKKGYVLLEDSRIKAAKEK